MALSSFLIFIGNSRPLVPYHNLEDLGKVFDKGTTR